MRRLATKGVKEPFVELINMERNAPEENKKIDIKPNFAKQDRILYF